MNLKNQILKSDFFKEQEHWALNQAFIDLSDLGLDFDYTIIKNDPILGFKDFPEFKKLSDDKTIKAILGIKRKNTIEKENTFIPILIVDEEVSKKNKQFKTYYKVPYIEYKNNIETNVRGFVYKEDSITAKFENIIDACNLAIQRYGDMYYHYYWTYHIQKLSEEFKEKYNNPEIIILKDFLLKIKELDKFNIFEFEVVDDYALLSCKTQSLLRSFDIKATIQEPKENFYKIRDITIKHLKNEIDIIFKIIMVDFLTMPKKNDSI